MGFRRSFNKKKFKQPRDATIPIHCEDEAAEPLSLEPQFCLMDAAVRCTPASKFSLSPSGWSAPRHPPTTDAMRAPRDVVPTRAHTQWHT